MNLLDFNQYKEFIRFKIKQEQPFQKGQYQKLAKALRVHPTLISQIFKGEKHLTIEQSCTLCSYLGLTQLETDYFIKLVEVERAGTIELKKTRERQLNEIRKKAQKLFHRVGADSTTLSEESKSIFYSNWTYSAVRLLTTIEQYQTLKSISQKLNLEHEQVEKVMHFLLENRLCYMENNQIKPGVQKTYIPDHHPLVSQHHTNWRLKAIQNYFQLPLNELAFTAPVTLSEEDFKLIKKKLIQLTEEISQIIKNSKPEILACINLDWFEIGGRARTRN